MLEKRLEKMELLKTALDKLIEKHKSLKSKNEELQDVNEHLLEDLDKSERLKDKNNELQEENEQLRGEIEDREQTVKEAASIIVNLEYEVGQLEIALVDTRPSTAETATETDTNYLNTSAEGTQAPSSPLQTYRLTRSSSDRKSSTPRLRSRRSMIPRRGETSTIKSRPSFTLSSVSYSTRRSLATGGDGEDEDDGLRADPFTMKAPPSLSVLSESSFRSIYGSPRRPNHEVLSKDSRDDTASKKGPEDEAESNARRAKEHRKARVDEWIQDRYMQPKKTRTLQAPARTDGQHDSTNEALQPTTPLAAPNDDEDELDIWRVSPAKATPTRKSHKCPNPTPEDTEGPSFAGPIFGTNFVPPVEGTPRLAWTYEPPPPPPPPQPAHIPRPHTADAVVMWAPLASPHAQTDGSAEGALAATATLQPGHGRRGSGIVGFGRRVSLKVKKTFGRRESNGPAG